MITKLEKAKEVISQGIKKFEELIKKHLSGKYDNNN